MTWQGGKLRRETSPASPFAPLKPLVTDGDDPAKGMEMLSRALVDYPAPLRVHVRLVSGRDDDEVTEHWEVQAGPKGANAQKQEPAEADVIVVMRPETWLEIATGRLAPYEALYTGRVRVGGNFNAAKSLTRHLTNPDSPYVAPC